MNTYIVEYQARMAGDPDQNIEVASRMISSFDRWSPEGGLHLVSGYDRLDGTSGYLIIAAETTEAVLAALAPFAPFASFETHPVVEFDQSLPIVREGLDWIRGVGF